MQDIGKSFSLGTPKTSRRMRAVHAYNSRLHFQKARKPEETILAQPVLKGTYSMKQTPACKRVTTSCIKAIMFAAVIIVVGQSSALRAQYGPRSWTPPSFGNFYSLQQGGTNFVPAPFLPYDPIDVPVYPVLGTTNSFVYDDTEMDLTSSGSQSSNVPDPPGPGSGGTNDAPPNYVRTYGSNDLWIELLSVDSTNEQANLTLHG